MSAGAGPGTYARPKAPDSVHVNFSHARHYYTTFGRGCLGGFYDASHRIATLYAWHEHYDDTVVTAIKQPVAGFTPSLLQSVRTARGVALGSTMQRVEAIEGRGSHILIASSTNLVRYQWHEAMRGTGVTTTFYLTFFFERDHLVAMDLGKRV